MVRTARAELGRQALIDAILLSRCKFMLKGTASTAEFAHYMRPKLGSYQLKVNIRSYQGWDYTLPEAAYDDYPTAWTQAGFVPVWTTPEVKPLRQS